MKNALPYGCLVISAMIFCSGVVISAEQRRESSRTTAEAERHYRDAKTLSEQGDYKSACPEFDMAVGLNPQFGKAHIMRGVCFSRRGLTNEAIQEYLKALSAGLDDINKVAVHHNLGVEYMHQGNNERAKEEFQEALTISPTFTASKDALALLQSSGSISDSWKHLFKGTANTYEKYRVYLFSIVCLFVFFIRSSWPHLWRRIRQRFSSNSVVQDNALSMGGLEDLIDQATWKAEPEFLIGRPRFLELRAGQGVAFFWVLMSCLAGVPLVFKQTRNWLYACGLIFLFAVIGPLQFIQRRRTRYILREGDVVGARVQKVVVTRNQKYIALAYESDGQIYEVNCTVRRSSTLHVGQVVSLVIDPDNPTKGLIYSEAPYRVAIR